MSVTIIEGDCRERLAELEAGSVHTCVTSPPYFGLRDYGVDGQMGLEPTPDEFVAGMVTVFREVRRVLRDDGTLWINIGDSYQNAKGQSGGTDPKQPARRHLRSARPQDKALEGFKPKDLIGIPWMLAFALRADSWYLRQDIIWSKPNPMPESVRDRCTKAHEYLFLFSKGPRYYYDAEAIQEDAGGWNNSEFHRGKTGGHQLGRSSVKRGGFNGKTNALKGREAFRAVTEKRNKRSVWEVATQPFREAHFATYPPELIEPCILAGCPKGGTVLDPFFGAGTTGLVADRLQRDCIGIELNPEYAAIARKRLQDDGGMFTELAA